MSAMRRHHRGFTLVEVIAAAVVLAAISAVSSALLVGVLQTQRAVLEQQRLDRMATIALLRMESHTREAAALFIPNAHNVTRSILAVAYRFDDDGDGLFDEDPAGSADASWGVTGFDDDGDGAVDEGLPLDDDEDGAVDEDPFNGVDDDSDGCVDEDFGTDMDGVGVADDDLDLAVNEDGHDAIVYYLDGTDLYEWHPDLGGNVVAQNVSGLTVTYEAPADVLALPSVLIQLNLTAASGDTRTFRTRSTLRNNGLFGQ
ncbi:MAG: prepilin-type N-terminal cleavage/methylation domain-containing protein [Phycisphaerales bacterium]|nr:prepilin-type N-terminal cleavage/methylation domain-containing protein [Phycisphaerales bacterium]